MGEEQWLVPATWVCALTKKCTRPLSACGMPLQPLSHSDQGRQVSSCHGVPRRVYKGPGAESMCDDSIERQSAPLQAENLP